MVTKKEVELRTDLKVQATATADPFAAGFNGETLFCNKCKREVRYLWSPKGCYCVLCGGQLGVSEKKRGEF